MLHQATLTNFGPLREIHWPNLGPINLVIGDNGSGKTFLLKALYAAVRTVEEYRRGDDPRTAADILAQKLYWTFQPEKIGDLVAKGGDGQLSLSIHLDSGEFRFAFGKDTAKQISTLENGTRPRSSNSIFLPAKEVLSLHHLILKSREREHAFGFDDTYLDLARALRPLPRTGNGDPSFSAPRKRLEELIGGKVEYDEPSGRWQFRKGNRKYPIGVTAEGIKKIAIFETLLENGYIDGQSLVFVDEPEAALHPSAISRLLDMTAMLAETGIQFFFASHSYFVVKKLFLVAREKEMSIPVLSLGDGTGNCADLKDGLPENAIIDESIRLYKEEVGLALQ